MVFLYVTFKTNPWFLDKCTRKLVLVRYLASSKYTFQSEGSTNILIHFNCPLHREELTCRYIVQWKRRLETFGIDDGPVIATGPKGELDSICNLGELTDEGRMTTWQLGTRLRRLYVDQLKFMPSMIEDANMIYLRATPIPRALESLQQAFWGMVSIFWIKRLLGSI